MDDLALVGSANASSLSAQQLNEAVLLTNASSVVSQAKSFIHQLADKAERLDENSLRKLLAITVCAPQIFFKSRRRHFTAKGETTWVVSTEDADEEEFIDEEAHVERAKEKLKRCYPEADPNWIRWNRKDGIRKHAKNGDCLIVISTEKGRKKPYVVSPPRTLLERQNGATWSRFYYDPDGAAPMRSLSWSEFQDLMKEAEVGRKIISQSTRALTRREIDEIQRLWPRKRRRKS